MSKISRNHPCPCGSRKKYKKCCLGQENVPVRDELVALMQEGYTLTNKNLSVDGCNIWLDVWNRLKERLEPDMKDVKNAEKVISGDQFLFNWCQDFEMELENAGRENNDYYQKRIEYCEEFCSIFPDSDELLIKNMERAIAESYFAVGNPDNGDACFEKFITKHPDFIWGYIGWGDMYFMPLTDKCSHNFRKAEEKYSLGLGKGIEEEGYLTERINGLKEKINQNSVTDNNTHHQGIGYILWIFGFTGSHRFYCPSRLSFYGLSVHSGWISDPDEKERKPTVSV